MNVTVTTLYELERGVYTEAGYLVFDSDATNLAEATHFFRTWEAVLAVLSELNEREPEDQ